LQYRFVYTPNLFVALVRTLAAGQDEAL